MLSIFIMYSEDRKKALEYTISCLEDMEHYEECQRTLVVDGSFAWVPEGWDAVKVPRINGKFCWGRMWDAGVGTAIYDKIVYLDSDRLLPSQFLDLVQQRLQDDLFLFTSYHVMLIFETPLETCKQFLAMDAEEVMRLSELAGKIRFDPRASQPKHGPGKNVMSGSTAFTKRTYLRLGGVDHWYCGHGAYADSDFHMQASTARCQFVDLGLLELHLPHPKLQQQTIVGSEEIRKMALDNFIYYCSKWNLPMALAENLAIQTGISRPSRYIAQRLKAFKEFAKES